MGEAIIDIVLAMFASVFRNAAVIGEFSFLNLAALVVFALVVLWPLDRLQRKLKARRIAAQNDNANAKSAPEASPETVDEQIARTNAKIRNR